MTLKIQNAIPMLSILMFAEDQHGEKQCYLRVWEDETQRFMWLTGHLGGEQWLKLDTEASMRMEEYGLQQLAELVGGVEEAFVAGGVL